MADDAAAPDGELTDSTEPESTDHPRGSTESPQKTDTTDTDEGAEDAGEPADDGSGEDSVPESQDAPEDAEAGEAGEAGEEEADKAPRSPVRLAMTVGLIVVLALGGLTGWLGWRAYQSYQAEQQRDLFLQVGRQAAINLTTIDFERADEDVNRILDSATDSFYDDFSNRKDPFVEVVKQAQSKSTGEVTAAGVESDDGDAAQVLVAITVRTSNAGAPEQQPRAWRMRISVKKVGDDVKVSNVEFVP